MSIQQQTQQVVIQRLNSLKQEIREIRKAIVVTHRLNALEQEIREIRKTVTQEEYFPEFPAIKQEEQQQVEQRLAAIEQAEQQQQQTELNCTLCSVTKPIDQRERKGKQKSSVCKHCANNRLKERRQKSKNDGTSQKEWVCGSTFQRWGLAKQEQTNKHKMYIKLTATAVDESDNGSELSDGV